MDTRGRTTAAPGPEKVPRPVAPCPRGLAAPVPAAVCCQGHSQTRPAGTRAASVEMCQRRGIGGGVVRVHQRGRRASCHGTPRPAWPGPAAAGLLRRCSRASWGAGGYFYIYFAVYSTDRYCKPLMSALRALRARELSSFYNFFMNFIHLPAAVFRARARARKHLIHPLNL